MFRSLGYEFVCMNDNRYVTAVGRRVKAGGGDTVKEKSDSEEKMYSGVAIDTE